MLRDPFVRAAFQRAERGDGEAICDAKRPLDVETVVSDADLDRFGYRARGAPGYRCLMRPMIYPVGGNRG